ncbi:MAG TPA: N-formylglutamate amidohydrolase [Minicystis sp.]|nr:N-formylglutamate amidohydrolase [Minicystis sp.]
MIAPFEVVEPTDGETPVVVEVPHAGVHVDPESLAYLTAPAQRIGHDADLYVDELFQDAPREGATLLVSRMSRYVVDLNRGPDDYDAEAAEGGRAGSFPRGLFWRLTTEGERLVAAPLPRAEVERRLELVYRPYHRALAALLDRKLARFGYAVLLCAHSMPSLARGGVEPAPHRADLVPGTRGRTSAAGLVIDTVDALARKQGWHVRHDDPYKGGYATSHYGRPHRGVHAIQIEIARRLYMDEPTLTRIPKGCQAVRQFGRTLAARLAFHHLPAPLDLLGPERPRAT